MRTTEHPQVVELDASDLELIQPLVLQHNSYFGGLYDPFETLNNIRLLLPKEHMHFAGFNSLLGLKSLIGARFSRTAPVWVLSFVFFQKRAIYSLQASGYVHLLNHMIAKAEAENRFSFFTAFKRDQLQARLDSAYRLQRAVTTRFSNYMPSTWYEAGDFSEADGMLGKGTSANTTIVQWTRPHTAWRIQCPT
jgi:hypothetical protein